jgi:hypothetical protein
MINTWLILPCARLKAGFSRTAVAGEASLLVQELKNKKDKAAIIDRYFIDKLVLAKV